MTDAEPCEQFNVLMDFSSGTKAQQISARLHETVQNISTTMDCAQNPAEEVQDGLVASSALQKKEWMEGDWGQFVHDGVCLS